MVIAVATSAYLRPGELLGMRAQDLVAPLPRMGTGYEHWSLILGSTSVPHPRPAKIGILDDALILDHEVLSWMGAPLDALIRARKGPTSCGRSTTRSFGPPSIRQPEQPDWEIWDLSRTRSGTLARRGTP